MEKRNLRQTQLTQPTISSDQFRRCCRRFVQVSSVSWSCGAVVIAPSGVLSLVASVVSLGQEDLIYRQVYVTWLILYESGSESGNVSQVWHVSLFIQSCSSYREICAAFINGSWIYSSFSLYFKRGCAIRHFNRALLEKVWTCGTLLSLDLRLFLRKPVALPLRSGR